MANDWLTALLGVGGGVGMGLLGNYLKTPEGDPAMWHKLFGGRGAEGLFGGPGQANAIPQPVSTGGPSPGPGGPNGGIRAQRGLGGVGPQIINQAFGAQGRNFPPLQGFGNRALGGLTMPGAPPMPGMARAGPGGPRGLPRPGGPPSLQAMQGMGPFGLPPELLMLLMGGMGGMGGMGAARGRFA